MTRALFGANAVGLTALFAYEVCQADSVECWLFEPDHDLAPVPSGWALSPNLVEYTRVNGQNGIRQWVAATGEFYESFQRVDENGYGGGSASWAGDPKCHPDCYPTELQGLGPLEYAVTGWGGGWDSQLWWFPIHGPASVPTFTTLEMPAYPQFGPTQAILRMLYRPLVSRQSITPRPGDDPSTPNAQPGVTVPDDPDWAHLTADVLADPKNQAAVELLKQRVQERTANLPTCVGMTFDACRQAIRDAGLTGAITRQTLSADDAIMEEDADRVTAIHPGGRVQRNDAVAVFVNPETMPTMTATETQIATQLEAKNPGVVDEEAEKPFAFKTIARRCARTAPVTSDCESLPIFVTGYDAVGPARNDALAIASTPRWALLHRRPSQATTGWYNGKDGCRPADRDAARAAGMINPQCHEFPFWSTLEAWQAPLNDGVQPRIEMTNGDENLLQGRALKHFYGTSSSEFSPRFPPCHIPATPDDLVAGVPSPQREVIAQDSAFLNVPVGALGGRIRTVGLCNDRPKP